MGPTEKVIVLGPWVGEFGWEVALWSRYCRNVAAEANGAKIVVWCPLTSRYLYESFTHDFDTVDLSTGTPDCANRLNYNLDRERHRLMGRLGPSDGFQFVKPLDMRVTWKRGFPELGSDKVQSSEQHLGLCHIEDSSRYVVIHARSCQRSSRRNWPRESWIELIEKFGGVTLVRGAGLSSEAYDVGLGPPYDLRSKPLISQCDAITSADLMIGPSSGPIALAARCKTPILTWSEAKKDKDRWSSRTWNPFGVDVRVLPTWQPSVDEVFQAAKDMLPKPAVK